MKIKSLILSLILVGTSLFAEEAAPAKKADSASAPTGDARYAYLKDYNPLSFYDTRFSVKSTTFNRRASFSAQGEVLDVNIVLTSNVAETKEFLVYVLAMNEEKDKQALSDWRANDPRRRSIYTNYATLTPNPIAEGERGKKLLGEEVLGKDEYKKRSDNILERQRRGEFVKMQEPSLDDFIYYLSKNPEKGLKVKIFGTVGAGEATAETDYKVDKEGEWKRDMNPKTNDHTYSLYFGKYQTLLTSHHYSQDRPDFAFFNKVIIMIFDPADKDSSGKPKLVFKKIHDLGKLKMVP